MNSATRSRTVFRLSIMAVACCYCGALASAIEVPTQQHEDSLPGALDANQSTLVMGDVIAEMSPALLHLAQAELPESDSDKAGPPTDRPYQLRRALRERDISIGFGRRIPISRFDGRTDVTLFQVIPRWGRFRDDRQEFLWEVPLTVATDPVTAYAGGVSLMYRYHFSSNRRFSPFAEIGPGFVLTNLDDRVGQLGGHFQFTAQAGIGVRTALSESSDLIFSARWLHLSNAGTKSPNTGLNNYLITAGYSRLF